MRQAASNAERMQIKSPIAGIAVIKTTWKGNNMAEIQEGDEVRTGVPVVDVVNPATMRVRARVNQADVRELKNGQPVRVGLDAYPDLSFSGTVDQISPIGVQSSLSPKVRNFIVLIAVRRRAPQPDARPDGVARRRAGARAGRAGRAARRGRLRRQAGLRPRAEGERIRAARHLRRHA